MLGSAPDGHPYVITAVSYDEAAHRVALQRASAEDLARWAAERAAAAVPAGV